MLVHLEGRNRPHVADRLLNRVLECTCFIMAIDHDKHLLGVHDRTDTDGQSRLRHLVHIVFEETAVSNDSVRGEFFLTGAAGE